ncbi:cysteine--tRNA ligase [Patescibacteria group bacterium]|nr:cysteine--tRNA ligase [Patescibacteria group bacterium]
MLSLYNTRSRTVEEFSPLREDLVTIYACGPTVYDYAHIGNFRTYVMTDILVRTLRYLGYTTKFVMNITDVGHLTSDSDSGEDKMEKGAKREGKTAWDIARFYTEAFLSDSRKLNLLDPDVRPKPTEHIAEQIAMVSVLLKKGFAYSIGDGIYFDTSKVQNYGALAGQNREDLKAGARVEVNPEKKHPTDFALWKFSYPKILKGSDLHHPRSDPAGAKRRDMEWESPWGVGFPGWHIECSAMGMKYLGDQIDIHTGGVDLIPIHHTNEIVQSESMSGKSPYVRFWVHGQFILVNGEKMSKSRGNFYRLGDIEERGIDPMALRYLYLTAHYRSYLNFSWEALDAAARSLTELRTQIGNLRAQIARRRTLSQEKLTKVEGYQAAFRASLENDLNVPQALAITREVAKSNIPSQDKYDLILDFDEVLGLTLRNVMAPEPVGDLPDEIAVLKKERDAYRKTNNFQKADEVRARMEEMGFTIEDTPQGSRVKKKTI